MARSPTMMILLLALVAAVLLVSTTQAFTPSQGRTGTATTTTTTALHMGLFDKKPAAKKEDKNKDVFGGRAPKITIRQDEDNAMWVEEPKPDKKKAPPKKGK